MLGPIEKEPGLKKVISLAVVVVLSLALSAPASAGRGGGGGFHGGGGGFHGSRGSFHRGGGFHRGCCWSGAFIGGVFVGSAFAYPYYAYPSYAYPYAAYPFYAPPPAYYQQQPQLYVSPPLQREVCFATGCYHLQGDGVTVAYSWVWVPAAPTGPPAPPSQ